MSHEERHKQMKVKCRFKSCLYLNQSEGETFEIQTLMWNVEKETIFQNKMTAIRFQFH